MGPTTITIWKLRTFSRLSSARCIWADACVHILNTVEADRLYNELKQSHINIGTGMDLTIKELAELIKEVVGFEGKIEWDTTKPDGTYKKQLDVSLLKSLNWEARIGLEEGLLDLKARL